MQHGEGADSQLLANQSWLEDTIRRVSADLGEGNHANDLPEEEEQSIYLSVCCQQQRLGIAYFDSKSLSFHLCETWEYEDFSSLQLIKFDTRPKVIITSLRMGEPFIVAAKKGVFETDSGFEVKTQKAIEFNYESAKRKLLLVDLPGMSKSLTPAEKLVFLSSYIEFENTQMVCALGGLISFLITNKVVNELEDPSHPLAINTIQSFSMEGTLSVDAVSLQALQIFRNEAHPSISGIGKSKEGFSLFGVLNKTKTPMGKLLLKRWFMRPKLDLRVLEDRFDTTSYLVHPEVEDLRESLATSLKHVKNIPRILSRFRLDRFTINDWQLLFQSLVHILKIKELGESAPDNSLSIFKKLSEIDQTIFSVLAIIGDCIDFDSSKTQKRVIPKIGVHDYLDELRQSYEDLDEFLTSFAKECLAKDTYNYPLLTAMRVVYYPQIGFQVAVARKEGEALETYLEIPVQGMEYQFSTDQFVYYKTPEVRDLDSQFGDIHSVIVDLENAVIREVIERVLEHTSAMCQAGNIAAELDCLLSLAEVAKQLNLVRPALTQDNVIYIRGGRHILQELCVEQFIPNDISIARGREGAIKLITGPNCSGKSVLLKQVALITFLSHIGSFVPAEAGLTDRIFTRIHSFESSSVPESSFLIDLKQVSKMMKYSTEKSLLVVDEFGKGTSPTDGAALLGATVKYFLREGIPTPKMLVATHYAELFSDSIFGQSPEVEFLQMDVLVRDQDVTEDCVVFLYKLVSGVTTSSYGAYCAQLSGISKDVIQRANVIAECLQTQKQIPKASRATMREEQYNTFARRFATLDCEQGDIHSFLEELFSTTL